MGCKLNFSKIVLKQGMELQKLRSLMLKWYIVQRVHDNILKKTFHLMHSKYIN